jgi:hypothetical protein
MVPVALGITGGTIGGLLLLCLVMFNRKRLCAAFSSRCSKPHHHNTITSTHGIVLSGDSGDGVVALSPDIEPPDTWAPMDDPLKVSLVTLPESAERDAAIACFRATLPPTVAVLSVQRVQNLPLWQNYAIKRHSVLLRESSREKGQERFVRKCLFHGTDEDTASKISQQGFNRSFAGSANAHVFGKGVYFARDASYSISPQYARPDADGVQRMFLVRVIVGEYCQGRSHMTVPDVRHGEMLYDTSVDDVSNPRIFVTYHDSSSYPEYLIRFSQKQASDRI